MELQSADILVVGGGAAGLMAAQRAASLGASVVVLEKNRRCGAKILISGGGRCNLTTTREGNALLRSFRAAHAAFLRPAFKALPPARLRTWFEERGVALVEEELEKVFPESGRALVIQESLLRAVRSAGADVREECAVESMQPDGDGFSVQSRCGAWRARRVILACGGKSWARSGTTGDGYAMAQSCGHTVTEQFAALAALYCEDRDLRALSGLSVDNAAVQVADGVECRFMAPLLFTHDGLSGPAAMDVSGEIEVLLARNPGAPVVISVDFVPLISEADLDRRMAESARSASQSVESLMPTGLPQRLRAVVLARAGLRGDERSSTLLKQQRQDLVRTLKRMEVRVRRTAGFDHAEVTRGGVALDEINPRSMESLRTPGLFVCGEVLDIDGPIGGFNFQAAFSTGWIAGEAAARSCRL